ncbi:MAG: M20/M25/M40 family metallo-hydrolase [Planctomycetota bacterium]|nr:M20/M25/M40 family metallo-hydrolase [Planctomycetota bacterium]
MHATTDTLVSKRLICETVDRLAPAWRELALRIHAHPELAYEEHLAAEWLSDALELAGFRVARGVAQTSTAFSAEFDTLRAAPCVAFLAEYDALPGTGHSCGHNLSGAASCLAGHALAEVVRDVPARIRVLGTPAEEAGHGGKIRMLEHGVFQDVEFAMMAHAGFMNLPSREMLGHKRVRVEFSAHAGSQDASGNTLDAVLHCLHGVELLRRKLRPRTRIEAVVAEGGSIERSRSSSRCASRYDRARAEVLISSTEVAYIERLERRLKGLAQAGADATGTRLEWTATWGTYLPLRRNGAMEAAYANNLECLGEPLGRFPADWSIGSTDCGNVSQRLPAIHAYFKAAEPGIEHHTHAFTEASRSELGLAGMITAAKAMALTALDLLLSEPLRANAKRDFLDGPRSS